MKSKIICAECKKSINKREELIVIASRSLPHPYHFYPCGANLAKKMAKNNIPTIPINSNYWTLITLLTLVTSIILSVSWQFGILNMLGLIVTILIWGLFLFLLLFRLVSFFL